ncbi:MULTISPECIES: hypothetical protein [Sphingomonas]|jgi:hypothetical protein|uniref:HNH endonuclease n=1 Tax=Sphingomonas aquatilis TaxID=93063 RepID=A0AAW3TXK2_9SPHN|nr:hypothetical protein [Sphingomonas aquatilis]MBB3877301.1 hypothetical protein [Sphingomonas aquatilis]GEM73221.1 hypothetical protein SAQ01S_29870 [Sphingomonas aquatilis NBRC 16722]
MLAVIILWHHPGRDHGPVDAGTLGCTNAGDGSVCDAVSGISKALKTSMLPPRHPELLPPPETPGAVDAAVTQANIDTTICRPGYARSARPSYELTGPLKRRMMNAQHPGEPMSAYELDHLIPISLGGAPFDAKDLWLQPRQGQMNAGDKNVLAYVLWRLVCTGQVPLKVAQYDISHDWTRAYQLYATPENIEKYHFRHGASGRE